MLGDIQALDFLLGRAPQANGLFDQGENNGDHHRGIGSHCQNTQQLDTEKSEAAAIEKAVVCCQEARQEGAGGTADAMDRDRTYRVVDLGHFIKEFHRQHHQNAAGNANDGGAHRRD